MVTRKSVTVRHIFDHLSIKLEAFLKRFFSFNSHVLSMRPLKLFLFNANEFSFAIYDQRKAPFFSVRKKTETFSQNFFRTTRFTSGLPLLIFSQ